MAGAKLEVQVKPTGCRFALQFPHLQKKWKFEEVGIPQVQHGNSYSLLLFFLGCRGNSGQKDQIFRNEVHCPDLNKQLLPVLYIGRLFSLIWLE
jgi:hypothetical protein